MNRHKGIGMTSQRTRERLVNRLREEGINNLAVLDQIRNAPRHLFVDEALASRAYEDTALPIGYGQTISQPYIVARMTEVLVDSGPMLKVLEIGTGSGYQTVVLARFADKVYSVERIKPLLMTARDRLYDLKIRNVVLQHNDGSIGWPEHAPYDAILAAAGTEEIPEALLQQLAVGGRLVIPVGRSGAQVLELITRTASGFERRELDRVSFVPLLGGMA